MNTNTMKEPQLITASIELTGLLGDVVFLVVIAAFFGVCVGLVKFCDHIVGGDIDATVEPSVTAPPADDAPSGTEVAA